MSIKPPEIMKTYLLLSIFLLITMTACVTETEPRCEIEGFGFIKFENQAAVFLSGTVSIIDENKRSYSIKIAVGSNESETFECHKGSIEISAHHISASSGSQFMKYFCLNDV